MLSVFNALNKIPDSFEYVAIHDAARPFAEAEIFTTCFIAALKFGSAVPAKKITNTLKKTDENNFILETIDRDSVWSVETPQVFEYEKLLNAYKFAIKKNIDCTDDAGIMEYYKAQPYVIENPSFNPKITYPEDINQYMKYNDNHNHNSKQTS